MGSLEWRNRPIIFFPLKKISIYMYIEWFWFCFKCVGKNSTIGSSKSMSAVFRMKSQWVTVRTAPDTGARKNEWERKGIFLNSCFWQVSPLMLTSLSLTQQIYTRFTDTFIYTMSQIPCFSGTQAKMPWCTNVQVFSLWCKASAHAAFIYLSCWWFVCPQWISYNGNT